MSGKRNFHGKEAMHRMNFLYQAASLLNNIQGSDSAKLSLHYGSHITAIGRKSQTRIDYNLKRTLCKGCSAVLIPGETAAVRLAKKPDHSVAWICLVCGTYKIFRTRKDYVIWPEKSESVLETIKCSSTVSSTSENEKTSALSDKSENKLDDSEPNIVNTDSNEN